jgi:hypothetical protein
MKLIISNRCFVIIIIIIIMYAISRNKIIMTDRFASQPTHMCSSNLSVLASRRKTSLAARQASTSQSEYTL